MNSLVVLTGPTAVGKTNLSILLAGKINGEIISADSMQVYKNMDIGSAKITPDEMSGIKHYLIDEYNFDEEFNVYEFQRKAKEAIKHIYSIGKIPIIVGGTGFYIQSVLKDIDFSESDKDEAYREELYKLAETDGALAVHDLLKKIDPVAADEIHPNNLKRVIRALEFHKDTGEMISKHNEEEREKVSPYNFAYYVLTRERSILYKRIDMRVDLMMKAGLLDEVKALKHAGATPDMVSMQGLGYKELLSYLNGECSLDEAVNMIKQNTRHFAKRQMTWFKREDDVTYLDCDNNSSEELLEFIYKDLKNKNII